ncbi:MAG: phosphatase [Fusobacteriaceae bacterium]|jgi:putative hydrolase|nr:phosphatase [Fusobacteriaceae bacterium]
MFKIDLHTHTSVTPHAYSTVEENIARAREKGMELIAITNHGPALPDSPHWWSLKNLRIIPETVGDLRILRGVEANIVDEEGNIDLNNTIYKVMDIIIAGFHPVWSYPTCPDRQKNTEALVRLMERQYVDIIAHPGNPQFPIDIPRIVETAKRCHVALEINNASLSGVRKGSESNCAEIFRRCLENGNLIALGSDAHISYDIGNFTHILPWIEASHFPSERILNSDKSVLFSFISQRKELKPSVFENRHYFWER